MNIQKTLKQINKVKQTIEKQIAELNTEKKEFQKIITHNELERDLVIYRLNNLTYILDWLKLTPHQREEQVDKNKIEAIHTSWEKASAESPELTDVEKLLADFQEKHMGPVDLNVFYKTDFSNYYATKNPDLNYSDLNIDQLREALTNERK